MENLESQPNPQMKTKQFPLQGIPSAVRRNYQPRHSRPAQTFFTPQRFRYVRPQTLAQNAVPQPTNIPQMERPSVPGQPRHSRPAQPQTFFTPQRFRYVRPQTLVQNEVPQPTNIPQMEGPSVPGPFVPGPSVSVPFRQPYMPSQQRFVSVSNTEVPVSQDLVPASNVMSVPQTNVYFSHNVGPIQQNAGPHNVMPFPGQFMQPSSVPMYCRPVTFYRAVIDPRTGIQTVIPQTVWVPQTFANMDPGAGPNLEENTAGPIVEEANEGPEPSTSSIKIECLGEAEDCPRNAVEITNPDTGLVVNLPTIASTEPSTAVTHFTTSSAPEEVVHQNVPTYKITRKLIEIVDPTTGEKVDVVRLANGKKGKKIEIIDPKTGEKIDFKNVNNKKESANQVETETTDPVHENVEPKDSTPKEVVEMTTKTTDEVSTKCEESAKEEPVCPISDETSDPPKQAADEESVAPTESSITSSVEVVSTEVKVKCEEPVSEIPYSIKVSEESEAELKVEVEERESKPEESPSAEKVTSTEVALKCDEPLRSESCETVETHEKETVSNDVISEVKEVLASEKVEDIQNFVVETKNEASPVADQKNSEAQMEDFVHEHYNFQGTRKYQRNDLLDILENMTPVRLALPKYDIVRREPYGFRVRDYYLQMFEVRNEVALHKSESAWQAPHNAYRNDTEGLLGRLKGILNKLTPQFFDTLMEQIKELPIDSEERLTGCINLLFEQSVIQPVFSSLYANLAKNLSNLAVPSKEDNTKVVKFRKLLLDKCQFEFVQEKQTEKIIADIQKQIDNAKSESERKILEENKMESAVKAKRRYLGTIRLIGELYKLNVLTENIMHECLAKLLSGSGDEDSIECLCNLLTTIGKDIDNPKSKARVDTYFAEMKKLVQAKKTSTRIRFMMIDLAELRKNKWVPRQKVEGPKKIDQIHKEAIQIQQKKVESNKTPRYQNKGSSGPVVTKPKVSQPSTSDWTTASYKPSNVEPISLQGYTSMSKPKDSEIKLGPSRGIWNKGVSSGTTTITTKTASKEKVAVPSFFAPLANLNNEDDMPVVQQKLASEHKSFVKVPAPQVQRENRKELEISRDEMSKKVKSRVDEYIELKDLNEAVDTIKELHVGSCFRNAVRFFYFSIEQTIEKSSKVREAVGMLHMNILKNNIAPVEAYAAALAMLTRFADDIAVDVPQIWSYLGEAVTPVFSTGSPLKLNILINTSEEDMEEEFESEDNDNTARLLAAVVNEVSVRQGKVVASEMWEASGLKWEDLVKKQPVEGFLKKFLK